MKDILRWLRWIVLLSIAGPNLHASHLQCDKSLETSNNCYSLTLPDGKPKGLVVLLPLYGEDARAFDKAKLPGLLAKRGFATASFSAAGYLFQQDVDSLVHQVKGLAKSLELPPGRLVIGGISAGGTGAARFVEWCEQNECGVSKPVALFSVDAPLDFERWWNSQELNIQRNAPDSYLEECHAILEVLKIALGGSPKEARTNYLRQSPFLASEKDGGNAGLLKNIPVRLYTEPDINWMLLHWKRDYYVSNALDQAALVLQLRALGNKYAELIVTSGKGFRPVGVRNPHSWTIVDEPDLVKWIESQIR